LGQKKVLPKETFGKMGKIFCANTGEDKDGGGGEAEGGKPNAPLKREHLRQRGGGEVPKKTGQVGMKKWGNTWQRRMKRKKHHAPQC